MPATVGYIWRRHYAHRAAVRRGSAAGISSTSRVMRADRGDLAQENRFPAAGRALIPMSVRSHQGYAGDPEMPMTRRGVVSFWH